MNQAQAALLERWDGFLKKIDERLREIMEEAAAGLKAIVEQHPTDVLPLTNACSGLDHRVRELRNRIQQTWEQQVEPKFSEVGGEGFLDQGLDRKADFEQAFDEQWARFKAGAVAHFYRNLWPLAQAAMQKPVGCSRCGGALPLPVRHESVSLHCPYCGVVNQVIAESAVAQYFGGGGHAFAEEATLPLRFEIERYRMQVDRQRRAAGWPEESVQSLQRWHDLELAYWTRYAEIRGQLTGAGIDREYIESRMEQFRKWSLESHQGWRRAQGR
jgi:predicted RNA-binding Zn-ribbon protein involved in translation (DUF1610 family)